MSTKKNKTVSYQRIWEIDLLRSLAVIGMIIFHIYYVLDYEKIASYNLFHEQWKTFGDIVRNSFFTIVGIGLVLSWQKQATKNVPRKAYYLRQIKKSIFLLFIGLVITFVSTKVTPDQVIRFGVLSFIGTGILLVLPVIGSPMRLLLLGIALLFIERQFGEVWSYESLWSYILGFYPRYWPSLDYFPIIPWTSSIALGGVLSHILFKDAKRRYSFPQNFPAVLIPLLWIGRNALWIYVIHIPLIVFLVWAWSHYASTILNFF